MLDLLTKYRPRTLSDVLGQANVVRALRQFAARPYSCAMLFHGESGIGKTATAVALAHDLGVAVEEGDCGGLFTIASGELDAEAVRRCQKLLRFRPMFGTGWRMLLCNEADCMSKAAEAIWLDALETLPTTTVVVFTTNASGRLSQRFRDRCQNYAFTSESSDLRGPIQALAQRVWKAEVGKGPMPELPNLGMPVLGDPDTMHASFRLALQQLGRYVREATQGRGSQAARMKRVAAQLTLDLSPDHEDDAEAKDPKWVEAGKKAAETRRRNATAAGKGAR